jgi:hypothetical protein
METVIIIILSTVVVLIGISYAIRYLSYSEKEEERIPIENYDLINPKKSKTKKATKLKTKK